MENSEPNIVNANHDASITLLPPIYIIPPKPNDINQNAIEKDSSNQFILQCIINEQNRIMHSRQNKENNNISLNDSSHNAISQNPSNKRIRIDHMVLRNKHTSYPT